MRTKFSPGDRVEVKCLHRRGDVVVRDWCPGTVVAVDTRMAAIRCEAEVYANTGWPIADRVLWSAHGSPNLRPQTTHATS